MSIVNWIIGAKDYRRQRLADWAGFCWCALICVLLTRKSGDLIFLLAPTVLRHLLMAVGFLIRHRSQASDKSATARISAYGVTALIPVYFAFAPAFLPFSLPAWTNLPSLGAWAIGSMLVLWATWDLRHAFSFEPQARELVTSGPYEIVRHPIYSAYVLQYVSLLFLRPSGGFALIVIAWCLLLFVRIRLEEKVLTAAFPEYQLYRERVGALVPRISRPVPHNLPDPAES